MNKKFTLVALAFFLSIAAFAQSIPVEKVQFSLVTKKTATWCPICGGEAWEAFQQMLSDNNSKAIVLAAHFSPTSELYSVTADELVKNFQQSFGQPVFFYNTTIVSGSTSAVPRIKDSVNVAYTHSPLAQTGLKATYNPTNNSLIVRTRTEFYEPTQGDFFVSVYLLRKEVVANQANRSPQALHKQVLMRAMTANTFGENIAGGNIAAGSQFEKEFVLPMENLSLILSGNLQVVAVLWKKNDANKYDFINAYRTETFTQEVVSGLANLDADVATLSLPTLVHEDVSIKIDAKQRMQAAKLEIFNVQGQKVLTLHEGSLPVGESQFVLQPQRLANNGIYLVRLQANNQAVVKKIIMQR